MFKFFRKKGPRLGEPRIAPDFSWSKVDESWLPGSYRLREHEVVHGPLAEFYPDGQLHRLSRYCEGRMSLSHNRLVLAHGIAKATVLCDGIEIAFENGVEEVCIDLNGDFDFFRNSAKWDDWVRNWIAHITAGSRVNIIDP